MRALLLLIFPAALAAAPLMITLTSPAASTGDFHLGTARSPSGDTLTVDSQSLLLNHQPWTPVMGEFHYARYPADEWREELLKLKAGGIDIVATYVFWIHHEEIESIWDWSGSRDLRRFIATAGDVGLKVIVRCGPWCHGEVRNGGLPEWVVARRGVRSDDPAYLALVRPLYAQIAAQLHGLLWKDGGPVIGVQLENEYPGPAEHLLTLKQLARAAGLDVPLYTRTGWPALTTPMPLGEILPLYGVYAEGFWDRELTPMPGHYWAGFHFSTQRTDANIANEALGRHEVHDAPEVAHYPFLTCEIGGGMMSSYHRRIRIDPRDIDATTLVKLGSGSNSPGYYMFHGGTNPDGRRTTLMETQDSVLTNWNDLPVKNYDFQAPLGQYGQVRPQYHRLRRLHLFLHDYGSDVAGMPVALPDQRPASRGDDATLRWSARSDGRRGFVFVNNYERLHPLSAKPGVQFTLQLATKKTLTFPSAPVTVPADGAFIWPFNLDLGGATLIYGTAQYLTHVIDDQGVRTVFFAETPGVAAEFAFDARETEVESTNGKINRDAEGIVVREIRAGHAAAVILKTKSGQQLRIVLLGDADSLAFWKAPWLGRTRVFLTADTLVSDHDALRLTSTASGPRSLAVLPAPASATFGDEVLAGTADGVFQRYVLPAPAAQSVSVAIEAIRPAGRPRTISPGKTAQPVAAAPTDADFAAAAVWRIKLPTALALDRDPLLRLHYTGDVARVSIGGRLIMDDFCNGDVLEIGLRRHAPDLKQGDLTIAILPLQNRAPILLPPEAKPAADNVAELKSAELVTRPTLQL